MMLFERKIRCIALLVLLPSIVGLSGCGSDRAVTYPVSGKVAFQDGRPLATGGIVTFMWGSEDDDSQITATGAIAEDGTYRLTTFEKGDGAVAGKHRILVRAKRPGRGDDAFFGKRPPSPIDPKYERYETSNLTFSVQPGNNEFNIIVTQP